MTEEMSYAPYEEEGGDWKKRFEMTIPLLLLILVLVVIGAKLGWLVGVPFIGDLFKSPSIDIAIIGNDQNLVRTIESKVRTDLPVNIEIFDKARLYGIRDPSVFGRYSMIILTEGTDGDTIELEDYTIDYLKAFVDSGKPAIVIGLAGSKVVDSPQVSGWLKLGFVPVVCQTAECTVGSASYDRIKMYVTDINHPILKEFSGAPLTFQSGGQITYTIVNPNGGTTILSMEIATGTETFNEPALINRNVGMGGGRVVYFAFHPSKYPTLLYNTIKYLR